MFMKTAMAMCAGVLVAGSASAADMTGYVSDSECAMSRSTVKRATDWIVSDKFEACVKKCAKDGSPLIFVTEDNKVLKFDAASLPKATALAGHHVKVSGEVAGDTLKVASISAIPMQAK